MTAGGGLQGKRVVVFGAGGFVGTRLCRALLQLGCARVIAADVTAGLLFVKEDGDDGNDEDGMIEGTARKTVESDGRLQFVQCDLRSRTDVKHALDVAKQGGQDEQGDLGGLGLGLGGAEVVFQLASYGMSGVAMLQQRMVMAVNVEGTRNVLELSQAAGVRCLVSRRLLHVCLPLAITGRCHYVPGATVSYPHTRKV